MHSYQLYHSDEIKKLKEELNIYKTVLSTVDNQHIVEEIMKISRQNNLITEELMKLKGDISKMNENMDRQSLDTEKRENDITSHMQTLDSSFLQLKQDVSKMMQKIDSLQLTELMEKVNNIIDQLDKELHEKNELEAMKSEMVKLKKQLEEENEEPPAEQPSTAKTSEFRRLQNMLQSQDLLQSLNRNDPSRTPSLMNQPTISQSTRNRQRPTGIPSPNRSFSGPSYQKAYTQPPTVNRNIITRIKPAQYIDTNQIEKNKVTVKETSSIKKHVNEKVIENNQPLHEKQEISLPTKTIPSSHTNDIQTPLENIPTETNHVVHNQQAETDEKQEKPSFLSIFRRN